MFSKLITLLVLPALVAAQGPALARDTIPRRPRAQEDTSLHPISLQQAVSLAQQNNVSAVQAEGTIRSASSSLRSARGEWLPSLNLSVGQTKSGGERLGQTGTLVGYTSKWGYNTGTTAGLTLFDGGKARADVRKAKADILSAEVGQTATQFSIALQVKLQYNSILASRESEGAAYAQLDLADQQFRTAVAKVQAGAANVSDSLKGVVAIGNGELQLLQARNNVRTASAALTRYVGTPYFVTASVSDTADRGTSPIDSVAVVQMALNGPSVRQAEAAYNSQIAAQSAARSVYLPTVNASFSYGGSGNKPYGLGGDQLDTAGRLVNPYAYNHTLSLSVNYQLFNRYQRENSITQADIAVTNAQATLKDKKLEAQQNIITQVAALRTAEEQIRLDQISVQANQEDLRVQQQRYALGAGTMLELLTTQNALVAAQQALIRARLDYRNARAQIESIIGRDLP